MRFIYFVFLLGLACLGHAGDERQRLPAMGWNSYDVFGASVTEDEVLENARYMKKHLLPHGWNHVVIDARWYDTVGVSNDHDFNTKRAGAQLCADEFGRMIPAPNRFPSSAGGKGFKPLADKIHAMGLKFGFHMMRGIPRQAVKAGTAIEACAFTAADAGDTGSICSWCPDMYGVRSNPAGQAWYDAMFRLYASWGLDFIKVDDLSQPYATAEIEMIRKAIDRCGRPIVFSTSPGPTHPSQAAHIKAHADMWRISGDFWDEWPKLDNQFNLLAKWQGVGGPGHWPDLDMIPLGHIGIRSWTNSKERQTRFTRDEQVLLMSLWALAPSPLMLGMHLPDNDDFTLSLLTNDEVIAVNQDALAEPARRIRKEPEIWIKKLADGSQAVGFFNRTDAALKVNEPWSGLGYEKAPKVRDLWQRHDLGAQESFVAELPPHGSRLLKATGPSHAVLEPTPTPRPTPAGAVFEAEQAALSGGASLASDHDGYTGQGFVAGFYTGTGQKAEFKVKAAKKGSVRAALRYANGMGSPQRLSLVLNGRQVKRLEFAPLTDWESWEDLAFDLVLRKGENTVVLQKNDGDGCINIDHLRLDIPADAGGLMQGDELKSMEKGRLAAVPARSAPEGTPSLKAWQDDKLGLFVHWGLYAVMGRGEWAMHSEKIPAETYAQLTQKFTASHYDPAKWMALAKSAGMRYAVLTARHHDGFALWDSPGSWGRFDAPHSAAGRDLVAPFADAARKAGLKLGLYYSPMDWRFPGYFQPKELKENAALMKAQGYAQMEELGTRFGKLDILWYDGGWLAHQGTDADAAWFWEPDKLNQRLRERQPGILISPRSGSPGDFLTDEGPHIPKGPVHAQAWEKCFSLIGSWGYNPGANILGPGEVVRIFVNTLVRGGNCLINVGPDPEGRIPEGQAKTLEGFGKWLKPRAEAVYGTRAGPWEPKDGVYGFTQKGGKRYLFVLQWPENGAPLELPGLDERLPKGARVIPKGKASLERSGPNWTLYVAPELRDPYATVIEL